MVEAVGGGMVAIAASIDRTAAAMSQLAERMSERRRDVKDLNVSFTWLKDVSNNSGAGATATAS